MTAAIMTRALKSGKGNDDHVAWEASKRNAMTDHYML